ncbi:MAG: DUF3794 domain-containing protein [Clostridiales bacterium]|nr:DUF3794 domain-containing protein [Clostridiales bacterium]
MDVVRERIPVESPVADLVSAAVAQVDVPVPEGTSVDRVLCCPARLMNVSAEAAAGAVAISGAVELGVLYLNEAGEVAALTAQCPFKHSLMDSAVESGMIVDARCSVAPATVTVSPGSLRVESVVEMEVSVFSAGEIMCVTGLTSSEAASRTSPVRWSRRAGQGAAAVTLREDVELPPGLPDISAVLWPTARAVVDSVTPRQAEAQVSGTLVLTVLYRAQDGAVPVQTADFEIPFSAPVSVPGLREDCTTVVSVMPADLLLRPCEDIAGNMRVLSVETPLSMRVTGWEQGTRMVVSDAYGLSGELMLSRESADGCAAPRECAAQAVVSGSWTPDQTLPLGMRVVCSAVEPVVDIAEPSNERLMVSGRLRSRVFYIDGETDALCCSQGESPFECALDLSDLTGATHVMVWADCSNSSVSRSGEGFAVQAGLSLRVLSRSVTAVDIITQAEMGEQWDPETMAPLLLVVAGPDDTVWSLARECCVTVETLLEANPQLADREVQSGDRITIVR